MFLRNNLNNNIFKIQHQDQDPTILILHLLIKISDLRKNNSEKFLLVNNKDLNLIKLSTKHNI
jgi:hypothetical protein